MANLGKRHYYRHIIGTSDRITACGLEVWQNNYGIPLAMSVTDIGSKVDCSQCRRKMKRLRIKTD